MRFPTIEQFEAGDVDVESFDHEAHVYVAWSYLQETDLLNAIARYRSALQRLVRKLGAEGKYHETITWCYLMAIAERLESAPGSDWPAFRQANPDLFERGVGWLRGYYSEERLWSARARRTFVLPDRAPAPRSPRAAARPANQAAAS